MINLQNIQRLVSLESIAQLNILKPVPPRIQQMFHPLILDRVVVFLNLWVLKSMQVSFYHFALERPKVPSDFKLLKSCLRGCT